MATKGFLSDMIMVKAMAAGSMLMSEALVGCGDFFAVLLLFRHDELMLVRC